MTKIKVLIVDDQIDAGEILKIKLQHMSLDYEVILAIDAFEALDMLHTIYFDLVITDYMMPGMDGLELIESIRSISPSTHIIMMSAIKSNSLQELLNEAAVDHFLPKPFHANDIHRIVEQVLKQVETNRAQQPPAPASDLFKQSYQQVQETLRDLRRNTGALCVFMVNSAGFLIAQDGGDDRTPISMLASLTTANGMATTEISRLLGNPNPFQSMIFEGQDYNVAAYLLESIIYLSVVFGKQVKIGVVQHYTRQAIARLAPFLKLPDLSSTNPSFENADFADSIEAAFDNLLDLE
jgi:DNA-binding response OmpR family regulator